MANNKVQQLIKQIEESRKSKVITYFTADQQNSPFSGKIALDVIPIMYEHLNLMGKTDKIELIIYSLGGDTIAPWRIVTLIREYCKYFSVVVPYKAHSAATLLALGANSITMSKLGELSPIDPTIETPFNPEKGNRRIPINVEDVAGFFNFSQERLEIRSEDNVIKALEMLVRELHPLAIGGVYRSHALIRLIATKLLSLHMNKPNERQLITKIVENLSEKLYYHNYVISKQEAIELGLKVESIDSEVESLIMELYNLYKTNMGLGEIFDPANYFKDDEETKNINQPIAIIESEKLRSSFNCSVDIKKALTPDRKETFNVNVKNFPWQQERK